MTSPRRSGLAMPIQSQRRFVMIFREVPHDGALARARRNDQGAAFAAIRLSPTGGNSSSVNGVRAGALFVIDNSYDVAEGVISSTPAMLRPVRK